MVECHVVYVWYTNFNILLMKVIKEMETLIYVCEKISIKGVTFPSREVFISVPDLFTGKTLRSVTRKVDRESTKYFSKPQVLLGK